MDYASLSPMMKQYLDVKNTMKDTILFYRLGDFYEMFFEDAELVSRELDLTLTGKVCGLPERAPMCGVPYHAADGYIAKLIEKGYRVAICEQMEDPKLAKGLVRRDVIRVVTPGTVIDADMLPDGKNNYIASLYLKGSGYGICFADVSTGTVEITEGEGETALAAELTRFSPVELLVNNDAARNDRFMGFVRKQITPSVRELYENYHLIEIDKDYICNQFDKTRANRLNSLDKGLAVRALGALIKYLTETQKRGVERLIELKVYSVSQYMSLSAAARRNLEITETMRGRDKRGSLLWVIDKTRTSMGRRMLRACMEKPFVQKKDIDVRLDACYELFSNNILLTKTQDALAGITDLERVMTRVAYGSCTPRDMLAISDTSRRLAMVKDFSLKFRAAYLKGIDRDLDILGDLRETIEEVISQEAPAVMKDGGYIKKGFSPEIDELRMLLKNTKGVLASMEAELREKTGIKQLKVGYNRVFGYYIEISKGNVSLAPDYFIRKQTLTTGERYITEELKELEEKIMSASERVLRIERELFEELRQTVLAALTRVQSTAGAIARLDVVCSFAEASLAYNYVRPIVDDSDRINIVSGRHPVVERVQTDSMFVPNDCVLDCKKNMISIITGPNMAGKSTYMRQTALIVLMAQMGCFVPAKSAEIGIVDSIYTRVGATDDLYMGQSTFMVEMVEVAEILRDATSKSLIILDEVGRGTSTYDGMSIARASIEYISEKLAAKTLFATHYHELTDLETELETVKNYNIAVKKRGDEITFLRRIVRGAADDSFGIEVAMLAGLPEPLTSRAKQILAAVENGCGETERRHEQRIIKDEITDTERETVNALKAIDIESLTPLEAMYKLNDIIKTLRRAENERD